MNDPNGLIYWKGRYHLFYQYNPASTVHENVHWGHASGTDLVHWRDDPVALGPTPGWPDEGGCWSGCAFVHMGQVYLLYTGISAGRQRPCLARALDDELISFEKVDPAPVITEEPRPGLVGFRDHTVWAAEDGVHQLIGSGSPDLGGCVLEYRSLEPDKWDYQGVFCSARSSGVPGTMWECPDLFVLGHKVFLVVSVMEGGVGSGVYYLGGTWDRGSFVPQASGRLDTGSRWYAPQSFYCPDGRRVAFGWLREREEELPQGMNDRVGVMSLPRELYIGSDGRLSMSPVVELRSLRSGALTEISAAPGQQGETRLEAAEGLEALEVEVSCPERGTVTVELVDSNGMTVARLAANRSSIEMGVGPVEVPEPEDAVVGPGYLRVFYDSGICEAFSPAGVASSEIYHDHRPVRSVVVRRHTADGALGLPPGKAKAWALSSIW